MNLIKLRTINIISILVLGALHSYFSRVGMNSDGISYLDMSDGVVNNKYELLINALWSPLYPFVIGVSRKIFNPLPEYEFEFVHLIDYVIFLLSFFSFDYFLKYFLKLYKQVQNKNPEDSISIPDWHFVVLGYWLFLISALIFITLWDVGPDMLASVFVYLGFSFLIKILLGDNKVLNFIVLGVILGLAYLSKAPMFILSIVLIAVLFFCCGLEKRQKPKILFTIIVFLLISLPQIIALSNQKQRFTFGESGKINYAWYINKATIFAHWQGEPPAKGYPKHPTRKILDFIPLYEFKDPIYGTYPPWTDPSYWYDGIEPYFDLSAQLTSVSMSLLTYFWIFIRILGGLFVGLLVFITMNGTLKDYFRSMLAYKTVFIPSIAAFSMFALVHLEPRYIAPFIVVFVLSLFSSLNLKSERCSERLIKSVTISVVIYLISIFLVVTSNILNVWSNESNLNTNLIIVNELKKEGIKQGDEICLLGYMVPDSPFWARILRLRVTSEITAKDFKKLNDLDEEEITELINAIKSSGAKVIVSKDLPLNFKLTRLNSRDKPQGYKYKAFWKKLEQSGLYIYLI